MIVADYSNGQLAAAQLRTVGFGGAVRYLRKRGPSGVNVLDPGEVADFVTAGFPFSTVYEDGAAGWMTGGPSDGADRGLWALDQARKAGIEPRCIYAADDSQHPTDEGKRAVYATWHAFRAAIRDGGELDGRQIPPAHYGADVAGFYGFRDTMRGIAAEGLCKYRWLTGSRPSDNEAAQLGLTLYQRNYGTRPVVAGVQLDVNDVLADDWGQIPYQGADMALTDEDAVVVWNHDVNTAAGNQPAWRTLSNTEAQAVAARDAANAAKTEAAAASDKLDALTAKVDALAVSGGAVDLDALSTAVADKLAARLQS